MEITFCIILAFIFECIVFQKHKEKWWKALIPGYNKYLLGKMCDSPKLGKINAVMIPFAKIYFFTCYCFEMWLVRNYATQVKIPYDTTQTSQIEVVVPKAIANMAIWSKYILIVVIVVTVFLWAKMMWNFTLKHEKTGWWVMLWVFSPVIPFGYFALTKSVYVDGKLYKIKKVINYE